MKPVIGFLYFFIFTYVVISRLYGKSYIKHHSRCGRASDGSVSHVTKTVLLTQTASFTASQESDIVATSPDSLKGPNTISGHDGTIVTTKTKTSTSDFPTTLPGATNSDICTQSFPCSGDITIYDPSVGSGACGGPVYQPTNSVIAIAYGMMGVLSSGTEENPLCGRYVQIENPANGKTAREMFMDKCMGCVSG